MVISLFVKNVNQLLSDEVCFIAGVAYRDFVRWRDISIFIGLKHIGSLE